MLKIVQFIIAVKHACGGQNKRVPIDCVEMAR